MGKVKVAVVQAASVLFDKAASIEKACQLIKEAGNEGTNIVLLPEAFVPAYPRGFTFGMKIGNRSEEGRRYCQMLCTALGSDPVYFNTVNKLYSFNYHR